jgi:hypothetical protein
MTCNHDLQYRFDTSALSNLRNGDLLVTKRHKVHKKFESSIQQIIQFVAFVICCG